ncbi:MAG: hypothetical protein M3Q63_03895 [bacterium]|nr:hypothetical protein [bacterium]
MKRIAHKTVLHLLGWAFILLGCLGFVLPLIPGFPLFFLGMYFLSLASLWLWLKLEIFKKRFPKLGYYFDKFDLKVNRFIKKAHY